MSKADNLEFYGCCSFCGALSRAERLPDGSYGVRHRSHCQFIRKIEESFPMPSPIPLESIPGPNGCPAAHLLASEREAFAKAAKDQVAALWRISEIIQERLTDTDLSHEPEDLEFYGRVLGVCAWALGNHKQLKHPGDVAVLVEPSEAPSSPGKPS